MVFFYGSIVVKKKITVSITLFDDLFGKQLATCTFFGGFATKTMT
jgi:hypothetical protein